MGTKIVGYGGGFAGPSGFSGAFEAWSLNIAIDEIDISDFASSGWKSVVPGCAQGKGSATGTCTYNASGTAPMPSGDLLSQLGGTFTLTEVSGCTFTFSGYITNLAFGRANCGKAEFTISFVSDGAVTRTWDETA